MFKFKENGGKFPRRVKNTVGKGEIAHHKQFLVFLQCFQPITRRQILDSSKLRVYRQQFQVWRKWQKVIQISRKHCYEQFLLFPQCF